MTRYIIHRAIQNFVLLWLGSMIAFAVYQAAPGGPIQFLDNDPSATAADFNRLTRSYGVDRPFATQYIAWMFGEDWVPDSPTWKSGRCMLAPEKCGHGIVRLDFGRSFHFKGESVLDVIVERIPATLTLALSSMIIGILGGFPLGILSALKRGKAPDHIIRVSTVLLNTVPHWWLGLILLIILGGYFRLLPLGGMQTIGDGSMMDRLQHLFLPATVGAIGGWIGYSRILRFEMLEVLNQDYVRTARAKGLRERVVVLKHVVRNAIMPFVTGLSSIFLLVLSGSILFENAFSWPGIGRLYLTAITARDYPLMMALFVISGVLGIFGLLFVDILYAYVDPRVKYDVAK